MTSKIFSHAETGYAQNYVLLFPCVCNLNWSGQNWRKPIYAHAF